MRGGRRPDPRRPRRDLPGRAVHGRGDLHAGGGRPGPGGHGRVRHLPRLGPRRGAPPVGARLARPGRRDGHLDRPGRRPRTLVLRALAPVLEQRCGPPGRGVRARPTPTRWWSRSSTTGRASTSGSAPTSSTSAPPAAAAPAWASASRSARAPRRRDPGRGARSAASFVLRLSAGLTPGACAIAVPYLGGVCRAADRIRGGTTKLCRPGSKTSAGRQNRSAVRTGSASTNGRTRTRRGRVWPSRCRTSGADQSGSVQVRPAR